jgi:hypothetical protein
MMLPRPDCACFLRPAAQELRPVRWNLLAAQLLALLLILLGMMWLAPTERGPDPRGAFSGEASPPPPPAHRG